MFFGSLRLLRIIALGGRRLVLFLWGSVISKCFIPEVVCPQKIERFVVIRVNEECTPIYSSFETAANISMIYFLHRCIESDEFPIFLTIDI